MKLSPADHDDLAEVLYQGIPVEPDEPRLKATSGGIGCADFRTRFIIASKARV